MPCLRILLRLLLACMLVIAPLKGMASAVSAGERGVPEMPAVIHGVMMEGAKQVSVPYLHPAESADAGCHALSVQQSACHDTSDCTHHSPCCMSLVLPMAITAQLAAIEGSEYFPAAASHYLSALLLGPERPPQFLFV